jgi:putative protein-disulfide isomerase
MSAPILHYIYDPLCGWCYGAAPLVCAARALVPVQAHAGGMMTGEARRAVTPELRDFVLPHDRRIAQTSGQPFGQAYLEGLLRDGTAVFDSEPPITAVLAAESLAGRGLDMLAGLQQAHYVEGRRIADLAVLRTVAAALGLDADGFDEAYAAAQGAVTQRHIAQSRQLLARVGGRGFPTLALENEGRFTAVDIGPHLGQPQAWTRWLAQRLGAAGAAEGAGTPLVCDLDGC